MNLHSDLLAVGFGFGQLDILQLKKRVEHRLGFEARYNRIGALVHKCSM
jgi:hypothetical protein